MASHCAYCGRKSDILHTVAAGKDKTPLSCCSEGCEAKAKRFYGFFDHTKYIFLAGIAVSVIMLFVSVFMLSAGNTETGDSLIGISMSFLGVIVMVFPFATPQTFDLLGIRKTVLLTRILGVFVIALGPLLELWMRS